MKKHRKLFKNFFLAVLCIGLLSSIMYITTHAANLYPDVGKLTTDWYYFDNGVFSTRSYEGQAYDNGVPYKLGWDKYTTPTGLVDADGKWYGYDFYGSNPWFTYLDNGSTALCNNSNDTGLTGYFWDGVGSYNNTLTLEFGVPSFVRDSTYIYTEKRQNYNVRSGKIKSREEANHTKYQWRLRSDDSNVNLVCEKKTDNNTCKYIPHYFNDNDNFVIGLDLKQVGTNGSGTPVFDGYVFVASPSGLTASSGHGIASGVYVLDNEPLTKAQLQAETPLNASHTAGIDAALGEDLTTFKTLFTSTPNTGTQQAWNPGHFVSFTFSTTKQANGLTTVSITVNGKPFTYTNVPNVQVGSLFLGAISQPCATYKNIKINGTVPTYTLHFNNGYRTGMSQTPITSITSKSISYGSPYGNLATASCLGYKTTASTASNWYYDSTNTITSSGILRQFADVRVEPHWTPITYTVKYDAPKPSNASTNVSGTTAQTNATYDTSFNLPGTGYTLEGYYCSSGWLDESNQQVTSPVSNLTAIDGSTITLHHTWAPNPYKVQFNSTKPYYATSVIGETAAYTQDFVYDTDQLLTANKFDYAGATFVGWATTPDGEQSYTDEQSVKNLTNTKDAVINLYAVWKPATYYVRYNRNLHDASGPSNVETGPFEYETSYTAFDQSRTGMSRDGYYIAYWTTNADGTGTRYYAGDKDWPAGANSIVAQFKNLTSVGGATVDLYAHWEPIKYELVYSKNDSTGGRNPAGVTRNSYAEMHYYNEEIVLKENKWTRVNELSVPSVFRGWNLLSDLNSTDKSVKYKARWIDKGTFVNGDSNKLCLERDSSITIYTVWDDVPVVTATDYELPYNDVTGYDSVPNLANSDSQKGLVLSKTRLEEILLANAVDKHGDREDGELPAGRNFRIEYFYKPSYSTVDHPTCYEVKYTVEDNTGNTYTQSAMLYAGYLVRIDVQ